MKSKYNNIQVYTIWVNGRDINDVDQHFPIDTNVEREWTTDFKKAYKDFYKAKATGENYDDIFQDYMVTLFSFDIDLDKFKEMYDLDFDFENENIDDLITNFVNYDFNTVCERVVNFKKN
jgi:hypothetical protein